MAPATRRPTLLSPFALLLAAAGAACSLLGGPPGTDGSPAPNLPDAGDASQAPTNPGAEGGAAHPTPPSCQKPGVGRTSGCGPEGNDDCCGAAAVPAGTFARDNETAVSSAAATITTPFRLDVHEVTVGRFRVFLDSGAGFASGEPPEGAGAHPRIQGTGWQHAWSGALFAKLADLEPQMTCALGDCSVTTWTDTAGPDDARPMVGASWVLAFLFCLWDRGRLPTDAEWGFASAGGEAQRPYPWGDDVPDPAHAAFGCVFRSDGGDACRPQSFIRVGTASLGIGAFGQADLAGNASEWVFDYSGPRPSPCTDCAIVTDQGSGRATRGGSAGDRAADIGTRSHGSHYQSYPGDGVGFRCARDP